MRRYIGFMRNGVRNRRIPWSGIGRTLLVEILVLLALSFAVVRYLEWSSDANQAEFMMRSERVELLTPSGSPARIHSTNFILERHALGIVRPPDASGS